ncbi:MAG: hypothetical protein AAF871_00590 [Pseudomonadota bacterium]
MKGLEVRTPFFRTIWRRLLVTGLTLGWTAFEAAMGNLVWAAVFGAAGAYLVWAFFIAFDKGPGMGADPDDE